MDIAKPDSTGERVPMLFVDVENIDTRKEMENMLVKKHRTIVRNGTNLYAKIALKCIILKVILGNSNIHV